MGFPLSHSQQTGGMIHWYVKQSWRACFLRNY